MGRVRPGMAMQVSLASDSSNEQMWRSRGEVITMLSATYTQPRAIEISGASRQSADDPVSKSITSGTRKVRGCSAKQHLTHLRRNIHLAVSDERITCGQLLQLNAVAYMHLSHR